jgi:hypothetical protein
MPKNIPENCTCQTSFQKQTRDKRKRKILWGTTNAKGEYGALEQHDNMGWAIGCEPNSMLTMQLNYESTSVVSDGQLVELLQTINWVVEALAVLVELLLLLQSIIKTGKKPK